MLVTQDVSENEGRIADGLERAAADEADFLLTPEGSLSGYYAEFDGEEVAAAAAGLAKRAKELGVGLVPSDKSTIV